MPKYEISAHHSESFTVTVKAATKEEALNETYKRLENGGVEAFEERKQTDREYDTTHAKEIDAKQND